jgi:nitrate/nitrite transport system permease protein
MSRTFNPFPYLLPLVGIGTVLLVWTFLSHTVAPDLPSPLKTWRESREYVLRPFFKDGEMNQGIARFALLSLVRVAKGFLVAIVAGTLLGYLLGSRSLSIRPSIR